MAAIEHAEEAGRQFIVQPSPVDDFQSEHALAAGFAGMAYVSRKLRDAFLPRNLEVQKDRRAHRESGHLGRGHGKGDSARGYIQELGADVVMPGPCHRKCDGCLRS